MVRPDPAVAKWCAEPIVNGDVVLTPRVLGPENIPRHRPGPGQGRTGTGGAVRDGPRPHHAEPVFHALLAALDAVVSDLASQDADLAFAVLPRASDSSWRCSRPPPPTSYYSEFARRYFGQGETQGEIRAKIKDLLTVLDVRGQAVTDDDRRHITACTDLERLDAWFRRAITAHTSQEIVTD